MRLRYYRTRNIFDIKSNKLKPSVDEPYETRLVDTTIQRYNDFSVTVGLDALKYD